MLSGAATSRIEHVKRLDGTCAAHTPKGRIMNGISKVRGIFHRFAIASVVGGLASTASASWQTPYCDGFNGNNQASVSGATCDVPASVDCWEDPSHNPPQWASGKTYARAQVAHCNGGVWLLRAYALQPLKDKMTQLAGNYYYAYAQALDGSGNTLQSAQDNNADGKFTPWVNI